MIFDLNIDMGAVAELAPDKPAELFIGILRGAFTKLAATPDLAVLLDGIEALEIHSPDPEQPEPVYVGYYRATKGLSAAQELILFRDHYGIPEDQESVFEWMSTRHGSTEGGC